MATAAVVKIGRSTGKMPVPPSQVPPEQEAQNLEKALQEFNLPDDQSLLIGWTQDRFADGAKSFFLAGLGLLKLHWRAASGLKTFSVIIEQNFPGFTERTAFNYMAYARAVLDHPAFEAFQKERSGYSKALTALCICCEGDLQEADETGELYGYTMQGLAKMSVRTMRKALLRAREKEAASVRRETAKAAGEIAELRDQVRDLTAQMPPTTPVDAALALIKCAEGKLLDGLGMLGNVERRTIATSQVVRDAILGLSALLYRVLENLRVEIGEAAEAGEDGEDGH